MPRDPFVSRVLDRYDYLVPASPPTYPVQVVEEVRRDLEANLLACAPKNCGIARVTASRIGWDDEAAEEFEERVEPPGPLFGLASLRLFAHGYHRVVDSPIDGDVRKLYSKMGFENGEVLDLTDRRRIETLAGFVARCLSLLRLNPCRLSF